MGINSIFMARNGVVELIPVLEELSHLWIKRVGDYIQRAQASEQLIIILLSESPCLSAVRRKSTMRDASSFRC